MKGTTVLVALLFVASTAFAAAPQKVLDLANGDLAKMGEDATIVAAVKAQNAQGITMDQIKKIDEEWIATKKAGNKPELMVQKMNNDCAKYLNELKGKSAYITEIFVTDNQGGNVCQTDPTSDYWQGDEAKFTKVFNGAPIASDVEVDDGINVSQASVPVVDGGKHIGTITIGINVDKL